MLTRLVLAGSAVGVVGAGRAQDTDSITAEQALKNARIFWATEEPEVRDCGGSHSDSGGDPGVIVVCRRTVDPERFTFDMPTRAHMDETASGAPRAPDFIEPCIPSLLTLCVGGIGKTPPPAVMVDLAAFPEPLTREEAASIVEVPAGSAP